MQTLNKAYLIYSLYVKSVNLRYFNDLFDFSYSNKSLAWQGAFVDDSLYHVHENGYFFN